MMDAVARVIMILAMQCLGRERDEWARAMQIEYDAAAVPAERRLSFAIGCLIAACREMPRCHEGRLSLASHTLSLAFLIPMAGILLLHAGRIGHSAYGSPNPFLAGGQLAAAPSLLLLWLMLGAVHLRLAWVLLEKDWSRVFNVSAMIMAGTTTLVIYMGILLLHDAWLTLHAVATVFELTAVFAIARYGQSTAFSPPQELA